MKLTTILLASVACVAVWPALAPAQEAQTPQTEPPSAEGVATAEYETTQDVASRIASLASYESWAPSCSNPCPAEDTCCFDGGCGGCSSCCRRLDLWGSAEFLLWWAKGGVTPPLVTTSPDGTVQTDAGVLPDATILFGQSYLGDEVQAGGRVTFGIWLDDAHNVGAGGRFYGLGGANDNFRASGGADDRILARPFYNVLLDIDEALLINYPGLVTGGIEASYSNQNFLGAEAFLTIMMERDRCRRIDLIGGYQFMRLDDRLLIDSTHVIDQFGVQFDIRDRFATQNEFHGGQIGLKGQMMRGCWSIEALGKIALGVTNQRVSISGRTAVSPGVDLPGGLLAQPTNIGEYSRDRFGYIPEFTLNLKYHMTPSCSFHVGYSIIWWSDVVTAGRQIDTGVNPTQLVGPVIGDARPAFEFEDENYWLQGINFGMSWDY